MTNSIIERAARTHWDAKRYSTSRAWDDLPASERTKAMRHMRAVLQAIREPSHAMCVAGDPDKFAPGDSEAIWQAMIDTALQETDQ